jgi:hypothetical protein
MREMRERKIVLMVALCSMAVGLASAQTAVWNPAANGITPPAVGDWADAANWTTLAAPEANQKTVFNVNGAAECVVTTPDAVAGQLVMGDNGDVAALHGLRIASGGVLTTGGEAGDTWSAVSYNRPAYCVVEAGGTFNTLARLGVGLTDGGDGLLEVHGDVSVDGNLQVGNGANRQGKVQIFDGGTVSATGLEMGAPADALIDIWQTGELFFEDIVSSNITSFIDAGQILGNRLTNNLDVVFDSITPGVTNATLTAIDSIPNLAGLTTNEAAAVLTVFGYVVGTITEGTAPGGITGLVAAQVPAAGTTPLAPGSSIDLVVQEAGEVPDVINLDYVAASNLLAQSGFVVVTGIVTYEFDATPGLVTGQSPIGGTEATPGDPVTIDYNEPEAPKTVTSANSSGNWMNSGIWSGSVVPERETQGFEVRIRGGSTVTLTNFVAMKQFRGGINGAEVGNFKMIIGDGGHIVAAQLSSGDYASIGDNAQGGLNVYSNGIFESRETIRFGWGKSDGQSGLSTLNIDGGTVKADGWMSFGRNDGSTSTETIIQNGGVLFIDRFRTDMTNGIITMYEGTFTMTGASTEQFDDALALGMIVSAEGYVNSLEVIDGNATLSSYLPGYAGWASAQGIGGENEDEDLDLRDNLYEYALDGDPKDDQDLGVDPVMVDLGGTYEYIHLMRHDDPNLVYSIETTSDLVNPSWANGYTVAIGTNVTGEAYDVVTNSIPTTADEIFVRLRVTNP